MINIDIVVTIPKKEYKNDDIETDFLNKNPDAYQFWTLNRTPKNIKVGDRVYFAKNNKIESSMKIFQIEHANPIKFVLEYCEVTDRKWKGECILYMNDLREENLNIEIKGFQGFRYKWW